MLLGTLAAIHRYPVKALRGETLAAAEVLTDGIAGDRTSALVVVGTGHSRTGKTYRGKENALLHTVDSVDRGLETARAAGVVAEPRGEDGRYFDVHPISLIFDTWLAALDAFTGGHAEPLRFRPNLVATAAAGFARREADLVGARLRVGDVELTVVKPIERCVTPSYDLLTGERDRALAKALAVDLGNTMGIYCTVVRPGRIATGERIELAD